jgi:deazaflavin-dependent oxidoreductase (nitroreductase family)
VSFTSPSGTYGTRQPRGALLRFATRMSVNHVRRAGGKSMGMNVLILSTVGRKSGRVHQTPVAWFAGAGGSWIVVASANGAPRHPSWYLNLAAHPDQVTIEVQGRKVPVTAEELHGAERDAAWEQVVREVPRFGTYRQKTDRVLPVIRLVERG